MTNNKCLKLAILGSTRGTNMQDILEAIQSGKLDASIKVVISNKRDAYILERAKNNGLDTVFISQRDKTREQFDENVAKILDEKKVDLILLIGYMRILSAPFVNKYKNKILNVHPSLLPAFAGGMDLNVHEEVIKSGVKETGCTIHLVDEGVDSGKIILQKKCFVSPSDTTETLKKKVQKLEGSAWVEVLKRFEK